MRGEIRMFWNILILVFGILSSIFAFPYGKWEISQKNKSGGIIIYIISTAVIALSVIQAFI